MNPAFLDMLKKTNDDLNKAMKKIRELDWESQFELLENIAIYAADSGWTIPPHTTFRECQELIEGKSKEDIDHDFQLHYKEIGNYNSMKTVLLSGRCFGGKWKSLLEDCFINYEEDRHSIVIPSLFLILEGVIFDTVKDQDWKAALKERKKKIKDNSINKPLFTSVQRFIDKAFKYGDFEAESYKHSFINRNWVLHGRDDINEWEPVDALRLFNALYSLNFFNDSLMK
ncbi:hypothetical protein [Bacillus sp. FJAT-28004]|uniref:hypothetical protein n=1 Tax=Bacillus sp. FJAT-28004 TaxID=1679165 RepID=UPI000B23C043|nr:hypothetical protein [Bacillus sp. FJAT-28004]